MDDLISSAQAAKLLHVTPRAVRLYHENGDLPGREIAGRLLFLREDVVKFTKPRGRGRPKAAKPAKPAPKKKKGKRA